MSTDALTASNSKISPLLRLPGEIRNRIYDQYFEGVDYKGEQIVAWNCGTLRVYIRLGEEVFPINTLLGLSRTSHQLRAETEKFVSYINKFFDPDIDLAHEMRYINVTLGRDIIKILHVDLEKKQEIWEDLWATPGLEKVALATFVFETPLSETELKEVIRVASKTRGDEEEFEKVRLIWMEDEGDEDD